MISDIVIIFLLILFKGIVTGCSSSLEVMDTRKAKYASDKDAPDFDKINEIMENSQKYNNGAGIINALLGIVIGFLLALGIFPDTIRLLNDMFSLNTRTTAVISAIVIILVFTYFFALFSIILPKSLAHKYPDRIVLRFIWILKFLSGILTPFVFLIDISVKFFNIFSKNDSEIENDVSENEILMMVDAGGEEGTIDEHEKEMINNIFDFDDKSVEEIATHRKDIVAVPADIKLEELINIVTTEKFTRIPVYDGGIDSIVGILHIKDFINAIINRGRNNFKLMDIVMKPFFVPSTRKADSLFEEMKAKNIHMAIIADEYGGTVGIVTMEDLIEEVMGEIRDEYDYDEVPDITEVTERVTRIEGATSLDDVAEKLGIEMPVDEYDTLGGFLIGQLYRIPDEKEKNITVDYGGYTFRIDEIEDNRIAVVTAIRQEAAAAAE